ncbi:MBL fold metallo-hydrolase [Candidatus Micrarchaeota archaeon]|nr:MBL fold metallo-hydrolase [Candidatus Micrarchaeota archaeon]
MKIKFLGACNEVGRSGVLFTTDKKIVTDYGIKIRDEKTGEYLPQKLPRDTDVIAITHTHLDHSGGTPYAVENSNGTVMGTPPTKDLMKMLLEDNIKIVGKQNLPYSLNSYKKTINKFYSLPYGRTITLGDTELTFHDAGHITGSAMVKISHKGKTGLYTGDINHTDSQLHNRCKFKEHVDYVVMESTYGNRNHPDRKETEKEFGEDIKRVTEDGGNVLVPAFAVDRSQEILTIIRKYNKHIPIFLDGMSITATEMMLKHSAYVSGYEKLVKALKTVELIASPRDRDKALREPSVVVSTSGMLTGGPALGYMHALPPKSEIFLTGYCVEETNGWYLMNKGYIMEQDVQLKIDIPWKKFDFSAHSDQREMLEFIKKLSPEKVFTVHGDDTKGFAELIKEKTGVEAVGPDAGDEFVF